MNSILRCFYWLVAALGLALAGISISFGMSAASFRLLPGDASAWAVSGDGRVVIGATGNAVTYGAFRWTKMEGYQFLGNTMDLRDLSFDGQIVVGNDDSGDGFRWSAIDGVLPAPANVIEVRSASADGSVLTGSFSHLRGREAYRWTEREGLTPIGDLPGGSLFGVAEAISADGSTIVGISDSDFGTEPFIWSESDGIRSLGEITGERFHGWAFDISDDATTVVGLNDLDAGRTEAFLWNQTTGRRSLGDLSGGSHYSFAHGVSSDGSVAVGIATDDFGETAFVWDRLHGMRKLQDVLQDQLGIDPRIQLTSAWDVSADGRTIVGNAVIENGKSLAYIAYLPDVVPEPSWHYAVVPAMLLFQRRRWL